MNKTNDLFAIDFFCSTGGVTCGFKLAGIKVIGGIDIDTSCKLTYEKNNKARFLNEDISKLKTNRLIEEFHINKNQDNLIFIGCSPCQYYSKIKTNKNKSEETRLLLDDFGRFVFSYRPGFVFVENVPGFSVKSDSPLKNFKDILKKTGYKFIEEIINVKDFGIPQNRRRYILIATRLNVDLNLPNKVSKIMTVRDAIGDYNLLKPIKAGEIDKSSFSHSSSSLTQINLLRIINTPLNGGNRRSWEDNESMQLKCYKEHKGHYDVYSRMFWDKPSPTITTKFNSFSNGRFGHPEQNRAISLREGAILQSFPNNYIFYSKNQGVIAKMIGNAVPPKFAKLIGECVMKSYQETNNK